MWDMIGRLFGWKSKSEELRELGVVMANGFREGLRNPPRTEEERDELHRRLFVEGHRFPTLDEVEADLWERFHEERR